MTTAASQLLPGSDATDYTKISFIVAAALANMQTVSICEVSAVHAGAQTVDVRVLVNIMTAAGTSIPHGVIYGRPYFRLQGGSSGIICDPGVGDIGIVVFGSRDLSAVIAAKGAANPGSQRQFDWADGVYLGGVLNSTPTQYLQFLASGGGINLVSPTAVSITSPDNTVNGPLTVTGATTLESTLLVALAATFTTSIESPVGSITELAVSSISPISGSTITFPAASINESALVPSGVTAGSYLSTNLTVNAQGLITAAANGSGGGGGGTVTSVGISTPGTGIVVGGGPIITAGTLTVDLSTAAYAALVLAVTSVQSVGAGSADIVIGGSSTAPTVDLSATAKTDLGLAATALQPGGAVTSIGAGSADIVIGGSSTAPTVDLSATVKTDLGLAATAVQPGTIQNGEAALWNSTVAIVVANTVPQDVVIPFACTLKQVIILTQGPGGSSISGSCTVDMSHSSFAGFPSSLTDMTGGTPPAIVSSPSPYSNTTFSGWTVTTFAQNDVIRFALAANSGFASVKIILRMF